MERTIITISESGRVNIPSSNVWMSEMELVELFWVIAPTLRAAIKAIYKNGTLCPVITQRCDKINLQKESDNSLFIWLGEKYMGN